MTGDSLLSRFQTKMKQQCQSESKQNVENNNNNNNNGETIKEKRIEKKKCKTATTMGVVECSRFAHYPNGIFPSLHSWPVCLSVGFCFILSFFLSFLLACLLSFFGSVWKENLNCASNFRLEYSRSSLA